MNLGEALKLRNVLREMLLLPEDAKGGICFRLINANIHDRIIMELRSQFKKWPLYSGRNDFPVPSPYISRVGHVSAFLNMPKWAGTYGDSRRSLVMFLLDDIERRIRLTKKSAYYKYRLALTKHLRKVIRKEVTPAHGLCDYIGRSPRESWKLFTTAHRTILSNWPEFSGCYVYPIGGGGEYLGNRKKYEGSSGRARRSLAAFIVKYFEDEQLAMELLP